MDVKKVFPLLFERTAECEKLLSIDNPEVVESIDETLVPDYPFGNEFKLDLNYSELYLPKECLEPLQQLFDAFGIDDKAIQLNLKYCLVSMINAKQLGFTPVKDGINEEAAFFSTGGHITNKLDSLTFKPTKGKPVVISSKSILAQIQQILSRYKWEDEELVNDLEAVNHESKVIQATGSNSLLDSTSKRYFFAIYAYLSDKVKQENNKKGIAQMMLYIVDFKGAMPVLYKDGAIDLGKKTFKRNKGGQLLL